MATFLERSWQVGFARVPATGLLLACLLACLLSVSLSLSLSVSLSLCFSVPPSLPLSLPHAYLDVILMSKAEMRANNLQCQDLCSESADDESGVQLGLYSS